MPPRKKTQVHRKKDPRSFAELQLREHYGLARKRAKASAREFDANRVKEIKGIMESSKKWVRMVNEERAKRYQKPLTLKQILQMIRESE